MILSSSSSSMSSSSSSSWSDLPLDLLLKIRDELNLYQRIDLFSFRSVCSQWRSAMLAPSTRPSYMVYFHMDDNVIHFEKDEKISHVCISLPFSSQFSPIYFLGCSNGWLVFSPHNTEALYLFDPVSNDKLIFPRLSPKLFHHHKKLEPSVQNSSKLYINNVVVSSSSVGGVVVVGVLELSNDGITLKTGLAFCRYGNGQRWRLLMEGCKNIVKIAFAVDGRFYAISCDWELYMLEERPPMIRVKKFKLMLPRCILAPGRKNYPFNKRSTTQSHQIEVSDGSALKIYGTITYGFRFLIWMSLKLDVTKLAHKSRSFSVWCEVERSCKDLCSYFSRKFTPSIRKSSLPSRSVA